MKRPIWPFGLLLAVLTATGASCGGAGRNCLVIPAQLELWQERREAALKDLETKANQVDRLQASLARARERLEELQAEKALLEQMGPGKN